MNEILSLIYDALNTVCPLDKFGDFVQRFFGDIKIGESVDGAIDAVRKRFDELGDLLSVARGEISVSEFIGGFLTGEKKSIFAAKILNGGQIDSTSVAEVIDTADKLKSFTSELELIEENLGL